MGDNLKGSERGVRAALSIFALLALTMGTLIAGSFGESVAGAVPAITWSGVSVSPNTTLLGISCLTVSTCFAGGSANEVQPSVAGVIFETQNGGASWTPSTLPAQITSVSSISCVPSSSFCIAVGVDGSTGGVILRTTNGGTTWSSQPVPANEIGLASVSCSSVSDCVASLDFNSAASLVVSTNGGSTWTPEATPTDGMSVSCGTTSNCVEAGLRSSSSTTDGGTKWTSITNPSYEFEAVSCAPTTLFCVAGGGTPGSSGQVYASTDGGASWTPGVLPSGTQAILGLSCTSTSVCFSVGSFGSGFIDESTDGGSNWTSQTVPSGVRVLNGITCPTVLKCYGVGQGTDASGVIVTSSSPLTIAISTFPAAVVGTPYDLALSASGGNPPYTWKLTSGKLPKGLRLNKASGVISGTPTRKATSSTFTIEVLDTKTKRSKGHPATQNTATATLTISVT
jgi:photosystem II stability/assembly factor-like uncharacterized protein